VRLVNAVVGESRGGGSGLSGKVALVTAGSRGIEKDIAEELVK
jgi:hypothetical protein